MGGAIFTDDAEQQVYLSSMMSGVIQLVSDPLAAQPGSSHAGAEILDICTMYNRLLSNSPLKLVLSLADCQTQLNALTQLVPCDDTTHHAMRVMADHIRATTFLISDGITPSNEGRGYVLRRIIRRAARHAYQLGQTTPFFHALVPALIEVMGSAYPALTEQADYIAQVIEHEEIQFTLEYS